jgi:phosphoribosyl-AMP cyclohydrolase
MMNNTTQPKAAWLKKVQWDEHGLVPVIAQEAGSNDMLMFAWMNREALARTVELGEAVYWSRSRKKLWHKGEESGHVQKVLEIRLDCDEDVVLLKIEQAGGIACHTGRHSCFFQKFEGDAQDGDWQNTEPVLKDPSDIYAKKENHEHPPGPPGRHDRVAQAGQRRRP